MRRRHPIPRRWLVTDERMHPHLLDTVRALPSGSGILFRHHGLTRSERARLRCTVSRIAARRGLTLVDEAAGMAARVHNAREVGRARLIGASLLFVSPLHATRSHRGTPSLPRMRAAALARLSGRRAIALGGMDERRFARLARLGFVGWAGIDAWLAKIRT